VFEAASWQRCVDHDAVLELPVVGQENLIHAAGTQGQPDPVSSREPLH
jgi:hypothetical protein